MERSFKHAMGGYNRDEARRSFAVPEAYDIITVIAVGYLGEKSSLSEKLQKQEHPKTRKRIEDLLLEPGTHIQEE